MSVAPKAVRDMRIIAIPLTRHIPRQSTRNAASQRILTYYQFQISSEKPPPKPTKTFPRWMPEGGPAKWISTKAADTWAKFGKAQGGWKLKIFQMGERLVDRMEFEELALKGIDPSLGPEVQTGTQTSTEPKSQRPQIKIPLIHPASINSSSKTLNEFQALVASRTPRHRKGFFLWMGIAPLTIPFIIIPIIPNIPFFFCVWRSWSHYKAYRASQYLQSLLDSGSIAPEPSESLDGVYKQFTPPNSSGETDNIDGSTPQHHTTLLTREAVPSIVNLFGLESIATADLLRAVEQARVRVKSGRTVL